jgi:hypothetical protein
MRLRPLTILSIFKIGDAMRSMLIFLIGFLLLITLSCSGVEKRKSEVETAVQKERQRLVEEYQKCLKGASEDKEIIEVCDKYLKAAEALQ